MEYVVTKAQMRAAEELCKAGSYDLMRSAGKACLDYIHKDVGVFEKAVVVLCGNGNNGGDGVAFAEYAAKAGAAVLVVFVAGSELPTAEPARQCCTRSLSFVDYTFYTNRRDVIKTALQSCDIIVDCIYGTGARAALSEEIADLVLFVNSECNGHKYSVDMATPGFAADTTLVLGAVKLDTISYENIATAGGLLVGDDNATKSETANMASAKARLNTSLVRSRKEARWVLLDIGIGEADFVKAGYAAELNGAATLRRIPARTQLSHKGTSGHVLNIGGCAKYRGACVLSTKAAYRAGAGLVTAASVSKVLDAVSAAVPEAVLQHQSTDHDGFMTGADLYNTDKVMQKCGAILVGCGLGDTPAAKKITEFVIFNAKCPVIIDADGINSICDNINVLKESDCPKIPKIKVITPHVGEFARLTGLSVAEINADRIGAAGAFALKYDIVVLLKGAYTVIAAPDGKGGVKRRVNPTGNAGLAVGGAGDVLAGIIAAFVAGYGECSLDNAFDAACAAVYLHGACADTAAQSMSYEGMLPSDIADLLPRVRRRLCS